LASEHSSHRFAQARFRFLQEAEELQYYEDTHRGELDEEDLPRNELDKGSFSSSMNIISNRIGCEVVL
jgi:hypothetical protein